MNSINQILQDAILLPEDQRLTLANRILMLNEPNASEDVSSVWDTTIKDRIARYDKGEIGSRPAREVFADLDRRLNQ